MKALAYTLIALAAITCAAVQPDTATVVEESAVQFARGEPLLALDDKSGQADPQPDER